MNVEFNKSKKIEVCVDNKKIGYIELNDEGKIKKFHLTIWSIYGNEKDFEIVRKALNNMKEKYEWEKK